MRQLVQRRRRAWLAARSVERGLFRADFDTPPGDERHRFLFHVHGDAGVGRIFPLRELEQIARKRGALTAYVDEGADSVPEVPSVMSRQFADRGARFKELDEVPAARRERRHEAESAAPAASDPGAGGRPVGGQHGGRRGGTGRARSRAWARAQRDAVVRHRDG
ncbi:hypothetical protein [Streptomyces griseoloalbus]|uniref:Uncharacterized protein n=1 Tax=Streptomyces griseoloalbus TaxID=67303 RepID=A0A7W8FB69_9ACTN|nr:hypothetical protein [Streptomyces albaduncus]MBB5127111.1 hypothetical protein [Streptomyces albaduncus]GGW44225.1 hypothetical protein GCM10010340_22670 [Streptomyces albaduncus]